MASVDSNGNDWVQPVPVQDIEVDSDSSEEGPKYVPRARKHDPMPGIVSYSDDDGAVVDPDPEDDSGSEAPSQPLIRQGISFGNGLARHVDTYTPKPPRKSIANMDFLPGQKVSNPPPFSTTSGTPASMSSFPQALSAPNAPSAWSSSTPIFFQPSDKKSKKETSSSRGKKAKHYNDGFSTSTTSFKVDAYTNDPAATSATSKRNVPEASEGPYKSSFRAENNGPSTIPSAPSPFNGAPYQHGAPSSTPSPSFNYHPPPLAQQPSANHPNLRPGPADAGPSYPSSGPVDYPPPGTFARHSPAFAVEPAPPPPPNKEERKKHKRKKRDKDRPPPGPHGPYDFPGAPGDPRSGYYRDERGYPVQPGPPVPQSQDHYPNAYYRTYAPAQASPPPPHGMGYSPPPGYWQNGPPPSPGRYDTPPPALRSPSPPSHAEYARHLSPTRSSTLSDGQPMHKSSRRKSKSKHSHHHHAPAPTGPPPEVLSVYIEDLRSAEPDQQFAELYVPLVPAGNGPGWTVNAADVCRELQSSASRIDGPAKVYTLRQGKFRQFFLRISAENLDTTSPMNLQVDGEKSLYIYVESGAANDGRAAPSRPPLANQSHSHRSYEDRPPPSHYDRPPDYARSHSSRQPDYAPSPTYSHSTSTSTSRKRMRSPSTSSVNSECLPPPPRRDHVPATSQIYEISDSSPSPAYSAPQSPHGSQSSFGGSMSPVKRTPHALNLPPFQREDSWGLETSTPGPPMRPPAQLARAPEEIDEAIARHIAPHLEGCSQWPDWMRWRGEPQTVPGVLRQYRYAKSKIDYHVGMLTPADCEGAPKQPIRADHVVRALSIPEDDVQRWTRHCLDTLRLLELYGENGKRFTDSVAVHMTKEELQKGQRVEGKPIKRLLKHLRDLDARWLADHPEDARLGWNAKRSGRREGDEYGTVAFQVGD